LAYGPREYAGPFLFCPFSGDDAKELAHPLLEGAPLFRVVSVQVIACRDTCVGVPEHASNDETRYLKSSETRRARPSEVVQGGSDHARLSPEPPGSLLWIPDKR
jgi:hypothetical protein